MFDESVEEYESINWSLFWRIKIPYKVQCFLWMLVLERVPTKMFLVNRGLPILFNQRVCPWCGMEAEDINHVFLSCSWVYKFWCLFLQWWRVSWCLPKSCLHLIMSCFDLSVHGCVRERWLASWSIAFWSLWLLRNEIVF